MKYINHENVLKKMSSRLMVNSVFKGLFFLATLFGLVVLSVLLYRVFTQGIGYLDLQFLQKEIKH